MANKIWVLIYSMAWLSYLWVEQQFAVTVKDWARIANKLTDIEELLDKTFKE